MEIAMAITISHFRGSDRADSAERRCGPPKDCRRQNLPTEKLGSLTLIHRSAALRAVARRAVLAALAGSLRWLAANLSRSRVHVDSRGDREKLSVFIHGEMEICTIASFCRKYRNMCYVFVYVL